MDQPVIMSIPAGSHIVLQAYGNKDILNECAFALLTLCRQHSREELRALSICIYTDQPDYFRAFPDGWLKLSFRELDGDVIRNWKGAIDFVHRVKIEVLRDYTSRNEGQILYLDTDVIFAAPVTGLLEQISTGRRCMHIMEDRILGSDNLVFRKLSAFFKANAVTIDGTTVRIAEDATMWNAGVLGFHTRDKQLLEQVLVFTDEVYRRFPKHVVEQFAFSLYFQHCAPLLTAHTVVYHYWNLKELRPVLAAFFDHFSGQTWEMLVQYSTLIQLPDYLQQKANFYYNRSTGEKLLKKKWEAKIPDWDLLVQQL